MLCVICENGWCALYEVHACAYTDRSNSTAETGVLICSKHRRLRRRHNIAWECCNDFLAYLSHLPIRNQEPRDRNLHQHHFVWLHRHTNKSFQKTEPIKTASEKWRNRERERERDYNRLTRNNFLQIVTVHVLCSQIATTSPL